MSEELDDRLNGIVIRYNSNEKCWKVTIWDCNIREHTEIFKSSKKLIRYVYKHLYKLW